MSSRIQIVRGTETEKSEIASFLAAFVRSGQLEHPRPGDDDVATWERRMSWWWNDNPMCREDSPLGYRLVDDRERTVGFHGFIPVDYAVDGKIVPSLLATTFFVDETHRDAVLSILLKIRTLGQTYQIVDGSPSQKMRELLDRLGFSRSGDRFQYFLPLRPLGGALSRSVLRGFGLSVGFGRASGETGYLAHSPEEIDSIPVPRDGKLRRHLTIESLSWLTSVGSEPRSFFGLCDDMGRLRAYAIGIYKRRVGLNACVLLDFCDLSEDGTAGKALLGRLVRSPEESGIRSGTDLVSLSVLVPDQRPATPGLRRESYLHYSLPADLRDCARASVPFESDIPLL